LQAVAGKMLEQAPGGIAIMLRSYCLAWLNTVNDEQILEMVRGGRDVLDFVENGPGMAGGEKCGPGSET
jgi:hypothetical protein